MSKENGVPPDAGASYLGAYTLKNEWAVWLLKNDPHLLSLSSAELHRTDVGPAPKCTAPREAWDERKSRWVRRHRYSAERCDHAMVYRPGFWCCYQHDETVRVRFFLKLPEMRLHDDDDHPVNDVLALIGKDVDVEYRDGMWRMVAR